jgi:hypothetical protein
MAGTGPLVAFKTLRLVGIPMVGFGYPPAVFWFHPFPCNSVAAPPCCHHRLSSTTSHAPATRLEHPGFISWSSGFCPPLCYQASQALSHQYYPWICHPLTPTRFGFSLSDRFSNVYYSFQRQVRRASLGKTHHLPISRPTSLRFGPPDIRSRSPTPARPPPRCHIVGSLFATYTGSASCFLQTAHFWNLPLPCWRCPSVR